MKYSTKSIGPEHNADDFYLFDGETMFALIAVHFMCSLKMEMLVKNWQEHRHNTKHKWHMDIGYCKRTTLTQLSTIFLGTNKFSYFSLSLSLWRYSFYFFFVNSYFESIINNGPCETHKWAIQMDKILWFHLQYARCTMHRRGNGSRICTLKIGPFDRTRWNVFVVHRSISVPAHRTHTHTRVDAVTTTFPARPTRAASHCDAVNSTIGTNWLSFYWRVLLAKGVLMAHVTIKLLADPTFGIHVELSRLNDNLHRRRTAVFR